MSENTIPPEMLEAATVRYMLCQGYSEKAVKLCRQNDDSIWQNNQRLLRLLLEAAGVPALLVELDAAKAMLAANDIYDTSLTDRISVLLERCRTAQQDAAKGWRAADQYLTNSETLRTELAAARTLFGEYQQANDHLYALKTSLTARIAELERELEIARKGGSESVT